jgi:hypothetical protein
MDYVADISNDAEGSKAHEQTRYMTDPMSGNALGDMSRYKRFAHNPGYGGVCGGDCLTRAEHKELFCAIAEVEFGVKMGVVQELINTTAVTLVNNILREGNALRGMDISKNGHRTWVLEAARILSIQHACYFALFSPLASKLYERGIIKRWSAEMFSWLVAPNLIITKDAVMHALQMFDFLYCSRDEDRLFASIALRCCSLGDDDISQRQFRQHYGSDGRTPQPDPNYLAFSSYSIDSLFKCIEQKHKHIGSIRWEDIRYGLPP